MEHSDDGNNQAATDFDLPMQAHFTNHCVLILDVLGQSDLNTACRLDEDISALSHSLGRKKFVQYRKARDVEAFMDALAELHHWCRLGYRLILHIEGHGDSASGLQVADSGQSITWAALDEIFREINVVAEGNLGIVLSTCFGYRQLQAVAIDLPSPYVFMIGPGDVISAGDALDDMTGFYTSLLRENNLNNAVSTLSTAWGYFDSQKAFSIGFTKHLEARRSSRETTIIADSILEKVAGTSEIIDSVPITSRRAEIKSLLRDQKLDFDVCSSIFFHGRQPPVTHAQLLKFAAEYKLAL